jgi:hypothetical protein
MVAQSLLASEAVADGQDCDVVHLGTGAKIEHLGVGGA